MTRQEAKQWLIENLGIEEPSNAQVSAFLNERRDTEESAKTQAQNEAKALYEKDYVKKSDYEAIQQEIDKVKSASAVAERQAKYKAKNINEKFFDYVDGKLKESKDFDKDLDAFITENSEFCIQKQESKEKKKYNLDTTKQDGKNQPPVDENALIAEALGLKI